MQSMCSEVGLKSSLPGLIRWGVLIVVLTTALLAATAPTAFPELEAQIKAVLEKHGTPGAAVSIVNRDGILWTAGIGTADLASDRAATPDTLFRIVSVSKGFVALSINDAGGRGQASPRRPRAPLRS